MRGNPGKTIATLALLGAVLPLNVAVVGVALLAFGWRARRKRPNPDAKTVMISGGKMTKALQLARSFSAAGHRVVLIESHKYAQTGHRFSRAVDRFIAVPEPDAVDYVPALLAIIRAEKVDVYVPVCSPLSSIYDSRAIPQLQAECEVIHVAPDHIETLDDKEQFASAAKAMGLRVPRSYRITDPAQVEAHDFSAETRPLILKSIAYDPVRRLDLTLLPRATPAQTSAFARALPISPDNPWIMQEFITGTEYCTHGTARDGALRVHCCCVSSAFQINYAPVDKPQIADWVTRFVHQLGLTGQASFDFIEADDDGQIYAIECNPRTHSAITMYYDHPDLAQAYLGGPISNAPLAPLPASKPTYWLYHELWRLVCAAGSLSAMRAVILTIAQGKDAVFDWRDPLPFLMLHHWQVPLLLLCDLREQRGWVRMDFNIGKLVQAGGD